MNGSDDTVETGIEEAATAVTATVTAPVEVKAQAETKTGLTKDGLDALKAMVALPREFGPPQMVALARDLAKNIHPLAVILSNHKLSNVQYEFLAEHNEFFKRTLEALSAEWQGIKSTAERLKHEALAALEEQLPSIAGRMGRQSEKLIDAVEAAKLFAKIADVDGSSGARVSSGERFSISIDLGADTRIVVGHEVDAGSSNEAAHSGALRADGRRQEDNAPLPKLIEGTRSA